MKFSFFVLLSFFVCLMISCVKQGEPTTQGELMTANQIKNLAGDDSMNGKIISLDGYYSYCKAVGLPMKLGTYIRLSITTEPDCEGEKIIEGKFFLNNAESVSLQLSGEKQRNCIEGKKGTFDVNKSEVITDDYQTVKYQKFRFSGRLVYDNGSYYLTDISIHLIAS